MRKWQTLEEFKANPVDGWCWISFVGPEDVFPVDMAYYGGGLFYWDDACDNTKYDTWAESTITHVQVIHKPEAPK